MSTATVDIVPTTPVSEATATEEEDTANGSFVPSPRLEVAPTTPRQLFDEEDTVSCSFVPSPRPEVAATTPQQPLERAMLGT